MEALLDSRSVAGLLRPGSLCLGDSTALQLLDEAVCSSTMGHSPRLGVLGLQLVDGRLREKLQKKRRPQGGIRYVAQGPCFGSRAWEPQKGWHGSPG